MPVPVQDYNIRHGLLDGVFALGQKAGVHHKLRAGVLFYQLLYV